MMVVTGIGRARKGDFPLPFECPFTVDERVSEDLSEVPRRRDPEVGEVVSYSQFNERSDAGTEPSETSGSSEVGKGGEDAKMERICISAV